MRRAVLFVALGLTPIGAGCGSESATDLPPAAGPGRAPALTVAPAGTVVPVGSGAEGLAADPRSGRVAVALDSPPRLALVDGRTGRSVRRVPLPRAVDHVALAAPGGPFLVPDAGARGVLEIDPGSGASATAALDVAAHDVAAVGGSTFVSSTRDDAIAAARPGALPATRRVAAQPDGIAPLDRGRLVAVVSARERVVELFDAKTLAPVGRRSAGVGPTHLVDDGYELLYVLDTQGGALLVFHLRPRFELTRRVALAGRPYGIAIDRERQRLWVTLTARNRVVELTADGRPRVLRELPTVRQPNSVAVNPSTGRVFVAGRAGGELQLIDP